MIIRVFLFGVYVAAFVFNIVDPPDEADWVLFLIGVITGFGLTTALLSLLSYNASRAR